MTNEEAKRRLEVWLKCMDCPEDKQCYDSHLHSTCEYTDYCDETPVSEAVKVAIKALEQQPCDAISREVALEKMADYVASGYADSAEDYEEYSRIICQLPPVTPQPKIGHWIESRCGMYICSECDHIFTDLSGERYGMNYCPNCGARMESEDNDADSD